MPAPSRNKIYLIAASLVILVAALVYWANFGGKKPAERYKTQAADRGDIAQNITANGTLNPVVLVNVGTQVSGTVYKLHVDFNSPVKAGQILAELDPALFRAQLGQSEANLMSARAAFKLAQDKLARNRELREKGFISADALAQFEQQQSAAQAQLALAQAQLQRDRTNLNYSVIKSPIAGVVVARNVDVGQTVAASFQTPTLFQIAQDLKQMQIDTSVSEADIGNLRVGQDVKFTVDAFREREFKGTIKQMRLNPTILLNVVTYNAVVAVANDDGLLLPGMTSNVRFTTQQKTGVLRAPNAALRYKPGNADAPAAGAASGTSSQPTVYRLEQGKPVAVPVKTGVSNSSHTEILEGDIKEGDMLVVREIADKDSGGNFRLRMF